MFPLLPVVFINIREKLENKRHSWEDKQEIHSREDNIKELWIEYENNSSLDDNLVKDLAKYE